MYPMRRIGTSVVIVVLFASIAGCSSGATEQEDGASTPTPGLASRPPTVATPLPSASSTVLSILQPAINRVVPAGFTLVPSSSGVLDLDGAADLAADPGKERSALKRNGFVRAYRLVWTRNNEASIAVLGYEFRAASGAASFERYSVNDAVRNHGADRFDVPEVGGATGLLFVDNPQQPSSYVRAVTFVRAGLRFGVSAGKATDPDRASVVRLAEVLDRVVAAS